MQGFSCIQYFFYRPQRGFHQHQRKITSAKMPRIESENSNPNPLQMCFVFTSHTIFWRWFVKRFLILIANSCIWTFFMTSFIILHLQDILLLAEALCRNPWKFCVWHLTWSIARFSASFSLSMYSENSVHWVTGQVLHLWKVLYYVIHNRGSRLMSLINIYRYYLNIFHNLYIISYSLFSFLIYSPFILISKNFIQGFTFLYLIMYMICWLINQIYSAYIYAWRAPK